MNILKFGNNMFSWLKESYVFYAVLVFNLFFISTLPFYPSMDGPAHIYNSNALSLFMKGDAGILTDFLKCNYIFIPNWISHLIMSFFCLIAPAWMEEKLLLCLYIIGMSISFRLLIKKICPENVLLSVLIFPFIYSFLFHLGFYNYCISFIFLFYSLFFWINNKDTNSIVKHFTLSGLLLVCYFSNVLTFAFLGLSLGLLIIAIEINERNNRSIFQLLNAIFKKLGLLFIISIPSLILLSIFYKTNVFSPTDTRMSFHELLKQIFDVRSLISYDYGGEVKITRKYFYIFLSIFILSLYKRYKNKGSNKVTAMFTINDILLVPALLSLLLYFIVPNGSGAGMMSDRYSLLFYMLLIIWMASQSLPKQICALLAFLILLLHLGQLFKNQNGTIRGLNKDALTIVDASRYINANSIVFPVNMTDNWLEGHFSNYLGVGKPIVILENYEASVNWFPLRVNWDKVPRVQLANKDNVSGMGWISNLNAKKNKQIDYVFLYGTTSKLEDVSLVELKTILKLNYNLIYTSTNKYVSLYKINK
jgi:hypothetical protein